MLGTIDQLPIRQWSYKSEADEARHMGPAAQDFERIFGLGGDSKSISTIDPAGIALAAIKELYGQNKQLQAANEELMRRVERLDGRRVVSPSSAPGTMLGDWAVPPFRRAKIGTTKIAS